MLHIIYNPRAGHGKSVRFRDAVVPRLQALQIPYQLHETKQKYHAAEITRELTADGAEHTIVAMGGDGTVHEILNGMQDPSKICFGILPAGSGNDFASVAGIPKDPIAALDLILYSEPKFTDYMDCSGVRGMNAIGTGFDVDVLRRCYHFKRLHGKLKYLAATLLTLTDFEFYRFRLEHNGIEEEHEGFLVCAGNGKGIGGGLRVCPDAVLDDGLLDFVFVDKIAPWQYPYALLHLLTGRLLRLPYVHLQRKDHVSAQFLPPAPVEIDGEIYEDLPFDIRIVHNALRMFRP